MTTQESRRPPITHWDTFALFFIILMLASLLCYSIVRERYDSRSAQCKDNLRRIGLAMTAYSDLNRASGGLHDGLTLTVARRFDFGLSRTMISMS